MRPAGPALGLEPRRNVLISNFDKHYGVAEMLRRDTDRALRMVMGAPPVADISAFPDEVRRMIQQGEAGWEQLVPEAVAGAVRSRRLRLTPRP
jgi:hypothetical protein